MPRKEFGFVEKLPVVDFKRKKGIPVPATERTGSLAWPT